MHLAIFAEEGAVGVNNRAGVVINAGGAPLEKGNDQRDFIFSCDLRKRSVVGPGIGFGKIEKLGIFRAAEIFAAKKFVHADDLRAALGGLADFLDRARQILVRVRRASASESADCKFVCHRNSLT